MAKTRASKKEKVINILERVITYEYNSKEDFLSEKARQIKIIQQKLFNKKLFNTKLHNISAEHIS